ncbi:archipelago beta form [Capsaspora owczarzaki ATCC 30864]|uniref:Archipelago beta form n=1 Tax=Capsaspora owczarzaki (strain ATCC 30864) TaxID=595528 RepID=A0A0D2WSH2_CAPO3|nr:archipelago beta form [Capsaspora owczarzaki ATCC 30864]KJE94408.1 archipelago beta form [Capsaspora owczarzaki ATCC 30864]|eukprot:XP_004346736.2 archipelago beta form [Capsaspora owczarzaki ATCC 30864]
MSQKWTLWPGKPDAKALEVLPNQRAPQETSIFATKREKPLWNMRPDLKADNQGAHWTESQVMKLDDNQHMHQPPSASASFIEAVSGAGRSGASSADVLSSPIGTHARVDRQHFRPESASIPATPLDSETVRILAQYHYLPHVVATLSQDAPDSRRYLDHAYPLHPAGSTEMIVQDLVPAAGGNNDARSWVGQFTQSSPALQAQLLETLLRCCSLSQLRVAESLLEPLFRRDFISLLPHELALSILQHLDVDTLITAARVSRSWRRVIDDDAMWRLKCDQLKIDDSFFLQAVPRPVNLPDFLAPRISWKRRCLLRRWSDRNWKSAKFNAWAMYGHGEAVITCLLLHDTHIISGADDRTVRIWCAVSGNLLRTLHGHTGGVWCCQARDALIVSGSTDRTLRIWNIQQGKLVGVLEGHSSTVRCLCLTDKYVVSGSRDQTLRIWSLQTVRVLTGHTMAVRCVCVSDDLIVSGSYDFTLRVWDFATGSCLHVLTGHLQNIYSLQFDGNLIASGSLDSFIKIWDARSGKNIFTLEGHQSLVGQMQLRGNILVSGNADFMLKVWDVTTGKCLHTLRGHDSAVTCVQFDDEKIVSGSDDGHIKVWDLKTGQLLHNLVTLGPEAVVWRLQFNETRLVAAIKGGSSFPVTTTQTHAHQGGTMQYTVVDRDLSLPNNAQVVGSITANADNPVQRAQEERLFEAITELGGTPNANGTRILMLNFLEKDAWKVASSTIPRHDESVPCVVPCTPRRFFTMITRLLDMDNIVYTEGPAYVLNCTLPAFRYTIEVTTSSDVRSLLANCGITLRFVHGNRSEFPAYAQAMHELILRSAREMILLP